MDIFITREETMRILECDEVALRHHIEQGHLTVYERKGEMLFPRIQVTALMEARDSQRVPNVSQESLALLFMRMRDTQAQVDMLLRVLGLGTKALAVNGTELASIYHDVLESVGREKYELDEIRKHINTITRLRREHFLCMTQVSGNDRPWILFHRLLENMMKYIVSAELLNVEEIRTLYMEVDITRTYVRNLSVDLELLAPGKDVRTQLRRQVPDVDSIIEHIAANKGMVVPEKFSPLLK